jgi:hypothetical protein
MTLVSDHVCPTDMPVVMRMLSHTRMQLTSSDRVNTTCLGLGPGTRTGVAQRDTPRDSPQSVSLAILIETITSKDAQWLSVDPLVRIISSPRSPDFPWDVKQGPKADQAVHQFSVQGGGQNRIQNAGKRFPSRSPAEVPACCCSNARPGGVLVCGWKFG